MTSIYGKTFNNIAGTGETPIYTRAQELSIPGATQDSVTDKVISTATTLSGYLAGASPTAGVYFYKSLTVEQGITLTTTNDYCIIVCTDYITVNGSIVHQRTYGSWQNNNGSMDSVAVQSRAYDSSRRSALYYNVNTLACSAGGGGGGGSGDLVPCDGGHDGDSSRLITTGASQATGGHGGIGGSNSSGTDGGNGGNPGAAQIANFEEAINQYGFSSESPNITQSPIFDTYVGSVRPVFDSTMNFPILIGGNGGPGGQSETGSISTGRGGLGGGMIMLVAPVINVNSLGLIRANGNNGRVGTTAYHMGGPGGGGGGGCIILASSSEPSVNGTIEVNGGTGGYNSSAGWPGSRNRGGNGGQGLFLKKTL